jgi:2-polyprenyl-3-methyl-5-hydroxy-6-metoxy-1,4-benzoquinol methylase
MSNEVSRQDIEIYSRIRGNVLDFQKVSLGRILSKSLILDIAPQDHNTLSALDKLGSVFETLDIDPESGASYVADITKTTAIPSDRFDAVFCTEVLEHVENPFGAILEIRRILKPGGWFFGSSPFNFRIHGPLPDNWRFSEHGWRVLLKDFEAVEILPLVDEERFLMPFHYTASAQKPSKV